MSRRLCKYCTLCKVKHSADHKKKKNGAQLLVQHLFFFLVFTGQNLKINKHRNIPTDKFQRWLLLCRLKSFHSQQKHSACPWHHHDGGSHQSSSSQSGNTKQSVRPDLLVFHFFFSFKKMSLLCTNKPKSERRESRWEQLAHTHAHTALYTLLQRSTSFSSSFLFSLSFVHNVQQQKLKSN